MSQILEIATLKCENLFFILWHTQKNSVCIYLSVLETILRNQKKSIKQYFTRYLFKLILIYFSEYPIQAMKFGLLAFHKMERHIPRLYVPNLIAKFNFMSIILDMKNFDKIREVTSDE